MIENRAITVQNTGKADLIFNSVTTTCGCTTASLNPMSIPVGGGTTLQINFDSGAHGSYLTGEVVRQVILISIDPQQPEATVTFVANILSQESP